MLCITLSTVTRQLTPPPCKITFTVFHSNSALVYYVGSSVLLGVRLVLCTPINVNRRSRDILSVRRPSAHVQQRIFVISRSQSSVLCTHFSTPAPLPAIKCIHRWDEEFHMNKFCGIAAQSVLQTDSF
ncbi:unnamed protein product [Calicophoron daubneyi]|uniref:Uncharacterized protein n=1 Tax=Calicophoron daubneyi TaxID=300641 RepID=A0AAV2TAQ7_CALDB